jgi:glutathione synthase/RimK-type ligase-like ATP-grasp enzyme
MELRPVLYPYKMGSESAHAIAKALDTYCVYPDRKYVQRPNHIIINWGNGVFPRWWRRDYERNVLNVPSFVGTATNKLRTLQALAAAGVRVPRFTQSRAEALDWQRQGNVIVCRTTLTGHEGRGIVLVREKEEEVPNAPLYTQHIRHRHEYRVHVLGNTVIDVAQKLKRKDFDDDKRNSLLRNFRFGWVFAHQGVNAPEDVLNQAKMAVQALQLSFGAVDVGYREKENQAYVFEINTAPGIEGTTVERYAEALRGLVGRS